MNSSGSGRKKRFPAKKASVGSVQASSPSKSIVTASAMHETKERSCETRRIVVPRRRSSSSEAATANFAAASRPFVRLVEQQQPRPDKQDLRFRKQLLLAAAQIGRMAPAQTVEAEPLRHGLRLSLPVPRRNTPLHELFAHGIACEERTRVLRHERLGCAQRVMDAPALGRQGARHQAQQGRLPAAVAAHDSVHRTAGQPKRKRSSAPRDLRGRNGN